MAASPPTPASAAPDFGEFLSVFVRIGCLSFGGPAGQIALMHRELVEERGWIAEDAFLRALNFCHMLPGPEAQQLATYIGWRMFGARGGLAAGVLFILPGALVMLGLSLLYASAAGIAVFEAAMTGVKAAVIALVVQALIRIGKRALTSRLKIGLAVGAFVALFLFALPFPVVIGAAALVGIVAGRGETHHAPAAAAAVDYRRLIRGLIGTLILGSMLWAAPVACTILLLGPDHLLVTVAAFFSKLAVVSFGGAYAVLSYMAQAAVETHHWLSPGQMADGLGLAETTPGPLILVAQFVGFLAGWHAPAPFTPALAALLASLMVLWVTFVPCFIWIFALGPWIEALEHARRLHAALGAITAAIVGVIANLAVWFALHVLFRETRTVTLDALPIRLIVPATVDWVALAIATGAMVAMIRYRRGPLIVLAGAVAASLTLHAL